jgi:GTPase SAR1 family protein
VTEEIPIVILGNKCDLEDNQEVDSDDLIEFASGYEKTVSYLTSARTGVNVEEAFTKLCKFILEET